MYAQSKQTDPFQCPYAWFYYPPTSSCIGITYTRQDKTIVKSWDEAEAYCRKFGGHLPSIHSMSEFEYIQSFIIFSQQSIWLGLKFENGGWKWSDGSVVDYLPWHLSKGYPTSPQFASCGRAELTFITNQNCDSHAAVLCKRSTHYSNLDG